MGKVIMLSGPVGAGKTTVARALVSLMPDSVACIEGDKFWTFIAKSEKADPRENFTLLMRSITCAAIPFARSGFEVVIDFSVPPPFLPAARKILKEIPLDYIILKPGESVCAARAAARPEGTIPDYSGYSSFYSLFAGLDRHAINNAQTDPASVAAEIIQGLRSGRFSVA